MAATSTTNPFSNDRPWITFSPEPDNQFSIYLQKTPSEDELESIGYFETKINGKDLFIPFHTHGLSSPAHADSYFHDLGHFCTYLLSFSEEEIIKFTNYLTKHAPNSSIPHDFQQILSKTMRIHEIASRIKTLPLLFTPLEDGEYEFIKSSSQLESAIPSEKPFVLLRAILNSPKTFNKLITNSLIQWGLREFTHTIPNKFITQCTNNAFTLGALFFGIDFIRRIKNVFKTNLLISLSFSFDGKAESTVSCTFRNIFRGSITTAIRKKNPSLLSAEAETKLDTRLLELQGKFVDKIFKKYLMERLTKKQENNPILQKEESEFFFKKSILKFPFNIKNLENLIHEMESNAKFISSETTCFYFIDLVNIDERADHAFIVEQFQRQDQEICYRLYQSWIGLSTLLEDLRKRDYDQEGYRAMSWEEMEQGLNSLRNYFVRPKDYQKFDSNNIFGYELDFSLSSAASYDDQTKIVRSRDLIYFCEFINPNDCWERFEKLATCSST